MEGTLEAHRCVTELKQLTVYWKRKDEFIKYLLVPINKTDIFISIFCVGLHKFLSSRMSRLISEKDLGKGGKSDLPYWCQRYQKQHLPLPL